LNTNTAETTRKQTSGTMDDGKFEALSIDCQVSTEVPPHDIEASSELADHLFRHRVGIPTLACTFQWNFEIYTRHGPPVNAGTGSISAEVSKESKPHG
jgi:hypothetical protein